MIFLRPGPDLSLRAGTERGREDCVLSAGEWKALKKLRGMHLTMTLPTSDARIVPISEYTSWFGKYNVRYFTLFFVRASARTRFIYGGTARSQSSTPLLPYPYNSLRVTESFSISIHPSCDTLSFSPSYSTIRSISSLCEFFALANSRYFDRVVTAKAISSSLQPNRSNLSGIYGRVVSET